jgi:hypothetical protein
METPARTIEDEALLCGAELHESLGLGLSTASGTLGAGNRDELMAFADRMDRAMDRLPVAQRNAKQARRAKRYAACGPSLFANPGAAGWIGLTDFPADADPLVTLRLWLHARLGPGGRRFLGCAETRA